MSIHHRYEGFATALHLYLRAALRILCNVPAMLLKEALDVLILYVFGHIPHHKLQASDAGRGQSDNNPQISVQQKDALEVVQWSEQLTLTC